MRRSTARVLRWLLATVALAAVAFGLGLAWLLTTEAGLARAIAMLESLDSVTIRVAGAHGRLIGPLGAASIDIEHPRVTIHVSGFEADYEPSELIAGRISAESVRARSVTIRVHEQASADRPPGFMPGWLSLVIDDAAIADVEIVSPGGARLRLHDVGGSARVGRSVIAFADARADAGAWAVAGAGGRLTARDPLGLDAHAAWSLTADRAIVGVAHATGDLGRLNVDARIAAPGTGRASLVLSDLAGNLRWHGEARVERLALTQWLDDPPFGPLSGTFEVHGDRSNYSATGALRGDGLPASGVRVEGAAHYADGLVTVPALKLGTADAATMELEGTVSVADEPRLDIRTTWSGARWPLTGPAQLRSASGRLQASGWREFEYQLEGAFQPAGSFAFSGSAAGRFTASQLIVEQSSWNVLGGKVVAHAMLSRDSGRAWSVSGRASAIDPAGLREDLPGRLAFDFAASGSGIDRDANLAVSISGLTGRFRGQPASGAGIVRRQPGRWQFEQVALALGPASLQLDGTWDGRPDFEARLTASDLSAFLPELGGHVDATLQWRQDTLALAVTGHDLAWQDHRALILSADAHVDLADRESSWLRLRSSGLQVAGQSFTDTRLSVDGLLRDHAVELRVGAVDDAVELHGRGSYAAGQLVLQWQRIAATGPRAARWRLESPAVLTATFDELDLTRACLVHDAERGCIDGRWRRGDRWSLNASARDFPLESLDFRLPGAARYGGLLSVDASASGRAGEPWLAGIRAEIRDAVLEFESVSGGTRSVALGRTILSVQSQADRHQFDLRVVDADAIELVADAVALRSAGLPFAQLPLTGRVRGATRQFDLLPLLVHDVDRASGRLALDLSIGGRVGAPAIEGEARLTEAALDFYQTNLRLRDLQATMRLHQSSLELEAAGTAGGGTLDIGGRLAWQDRRISGLLTLKGDHLLLVDLPEARVLASPDLSFALADRRIDVGGSVNVPEARIAPAASAGAVLPSTDERIVTPDAGAGDGGSFDVTTDVRLQLGDKVELDAYGLRGRISGGMRARSAPREAAVATGEFQIHDGEYRAYTRELDVERGRLLFTGGPVTDPGVDLRASRKLPGYTVGVIVRGRLRQPQLTLFSEPGLPQAQIASLLIVGRSLDTLQDQDRASLESENHRLATEGGALLAGQLGRYVGLDEVGVAEDADSGAALVLGKFLSPRLYVSYGISLVDEINTLKLRYTIGDRWVISAESGREAAADIEYRIER